MSDILHRWCVASLADALEAQLRDEETRLKTEQSVSGLDARDEVTLHALLSEGLETAGHGVHRECRYPAARSHRRRSEGDRCDLVLTPDKRPLQVPESDATLFVDPQAFPLEDAFWLEVKVVSQFTEDGGNSSYSTQLLSTVREDVAKLSKDPGILHAGLLILLFTADPAIAEHDLGIWQDKCLEKSMPISAPCHRVIPIADRLGNKCCTMRIYPVRHY
ncbi:MAG: hypothetical protein P8M22_06510 [Phycisphaerales bacterium]|nr:hypothetical protein [Phycisphaerales bacterium]